MIHSEQDQLATATSMSGEGSQTRIETSVPNLFKYSHKFKRPYEEGQGPRDVQTTSIYNAKLTNLVQEQLDFCKIDRATHNIETVSSEVETFFKDNLIRRFDQIQLLKMKIAQQEISNHNRDRIRKEINDKLIMTKQSKVLVDTFRSCMEQVRQEKDTVRKQNMQVFRQLNPISTLSKEDLNSMDQKRVLEMFVENDAALSLLLDFISTRHLDGQGFSSNSFDDT